MLFLPLQHCFTVIITSTTPSPASRAKLNMLNTVSKIRGQVKTTGYPQTEGLLGDCMMRYGHELGEDSVFGTDSYISESFRDSSCSQVFIKRGVDVSFSFSHASFPTEKSALE